METNKADEYACKKYNVKDGLNDYDENYFNSTNVNLAKAFIEGAEYRQSEIDELTKEVERLRKERDKLIAEIRAKDIPYTDMDFGVGDLD